MLVHLAELADPERRGEAARTLAHQLGAEDFLLFVRDPEAHVLLPARGFPQTLPPGRAWRRFLEDCERSRTAEAQLPVPGSTALRRVLGCVASDGSVAVLVGGQPRTEALEQLCAYLPLLAVALRIERGRAAALNHAGAAAEAAEQARQLATRLDGTRRELEEALRAAERARTRAAFLAEVGVQLAGSLDLDAALTAIVERAAPWLADWCAADLLNPDGTVQRASMRAHAAGEAERARLQQGYQPSPVRLAHLAERLHQGGTWHVPDVAHALAHAEGLSAQHLALLDALGIRALLVVPMVHRARSLGALTFALQGDARRFGPDEVQLAEDLAHRVALAVDNASLYRDAQLALHARDEFFAVASHELRSPLTGLSLRLEMLQNALEHPDPARPPAALLRHVTLARKLTDRLTALTANLFDVTRLTTGQLRLDRLPVDLGATVVDVVERLAESAAGAGCPLDVRCEEGLVGLWDRLRVEQVVTNLVANAVKYAPRAAIEVRAARDGGCACLSVQDHGPGIAPEHLQRIFRRFERVAASGQADGLGLGLYITQQIVEAHGGAIQVASRPGEGATFTVRLPLRAPEP